MYLLGYHGTSAASALQLVKYGPRESHAYAALGSGLYVARDDDFLVGYFSRAAESRDMFNPAHHGKKAVGINPFKGPTILKVFSRVPLFQLKECRWDIMEYSQCKFHCRDNLNDLQGMANNLQMVIPPQYFRFLRIVQHVKTTARSERPVSWPVNESPLSNNRDKALPLKRRHSF